MEPTQRQRALGSSRFSGAGALRRPVRRRQPRIRMLVRHGSGITRVRRIGGVALRQTRPLPSTASISASCMSWALFRVRRSPTEACTASASRVPGWADRR
ncbi:hypothetical protein D3C78_1476030 [compost metagenome]